MRPDRPDGMTGRSWRTRVADVHQPARGCRVQLAGQPPAVGIGRRNSSTAASTVGSTARRRISSVKCCASGCFRRWPAEHRAQGRSPGAGPAPADRESAAADRRGGRPIAPASAASARCLRHRHQHVRRAPSAGSRRRCGYRRAKDRAHRPLAVTRAGHWARRTARARRRHDTPSAAATPRRASSCTAEDVGDVSSVPGAANGPRGEARSMASRPFSDAVRLR